MKKLLIGCILMLLLSGCQTAHKTKMIVPFGSTEMSQLYMQADASYQVDIVQGVDPLIAAFGSKSHDVIFAPLTLGAKMYQARPDYQLLATIIWGNFYVVTTKPGISSFEDLNGQSVVIFGKNQTADILMNYLLSELHIEINATYVDNLVQATSEFMLDSSRIVLVAEPNHAMLKLLYPNLTSISIQDVYERVTGDARIPQAGVFVRSTLSLSKKIKIATDLSHSIEKLYQFPEETLHMMISRNPTLNQEALLLSLSDQHIEFIQGEDAKARMLSYFSIIMTTNPNIIGSELPPDDFYLKVIS